MQYCHCCAVDDALVQQLVVHSCCYRYCCCHDPNLHKSITMHKESSDITYKKHKTKQFAKENYQRPHEKEPFRQQDNITRYAC
eukprot:8922-Heterococcus_DN1.PRE.1